MKTTLKTLTLVAAACGALASLSACAPLVVGSAMVGGALVATDRRTTGTQVEDQGIELKAATRIREAMGSRTRINVQSHNRVLLISGEVRNDADKAEAERIASQVENVQRVVNEIQVGFLASLTQRSSDLVLAGKVKATLIDARDLQSNAFNVVVERGEVYLMGIVTEREANRATELVRGIPGVVKVVRVMEVISEQELARRAPARPEPAKAM
jgi:osmotically-inducible protein OsmY